MSTGWRASSVFERHLNASRFLVDPPGSALKFREESDITELQIGSVRLFLVHSAELAQDVLYDNMEGYTKGSSFWQSISDVVGESLAMRTGEDWLRHRRKVQRAFSADVVAPLVSRSISQLVDEVGDREVLDASDFGVGLSVQTIASALFGTRLDSRRLSRMCSDMSGVVKGLPLAGLHHALPALLRRMTQRGMNEFKSSIGGLRSQVRQLLAESDGIELQAMADVLRVEYQDDPPDALEDELTGLFLAGFDTTANGIAWSLHLLAMNPDVQNSMRSELESVLGGRAPTHDDMPKLSFAESVMREALRLYPPGWVVVRVASRPESLAGRDVPEGSIVALVAYSIQRDPRHWVNPNAFNPERFRGPKTGHHRFAWIPFSAGPRVCIGMRLALLEGALAISHITQRYRVLPVGREKVDLKASVTLKSTKPISVRLKRV